MSELIGQRLGQYVVTGAIGKGGMSTVYQATQASMKRSVAIKVLPRTLTHEDKFLERFYQEVEIVASLQHPHILPVYDFGEFDGMPYIVMAYLTGGTLGDLIVQGPLDPHETLRITREMADALEYAHSKGVIHRDFKPGNVLLDEQKNTYLTDFGLAKLSESSMQITGTGILGTPSYMAPEQAEPNPLTPAADVYALGVTIFQMLTGRVPYDAPTPLGVLMAHMTQPIPKIHQIRADLPTEAQMVIDRSMAKSVSARYATPSALAEALSQALTGTAGEVRQTPAESSKGLLMTNVIGQVIFIDHPCLRLLKRSQAEARTIIGKPLHEVLGLDKQQADNLMQTVGKSGQINGERIEIRDARGTPIPVLYSATATRDDKNAFVGADVTLQPIQDVVIASGEFKSKAVSLDTSEENIIQRYFVRQMEALRNSLVEWGGQRLGRNLDRIIQETAQRNVWPVTMQEGQILVELQSTDLDIYRALLAKGIAYAVGLVGKKVVIKGMQTVDKQLDARILELAKELRVYELFDIL